jgi:hypothetical protein
MLRWRYHDIIIKVGGEDENKKIFTDQKMDLREVIVKYSRLVVFIRHDSAEIWGFRYGRTLGIGTKKLLPAPVFSCG